MLPSRRAARLPRDPDARVLRNGIDTLLEIAESKTVSLIYAEEDPSKYHRRLLIEPALLDRDIDLR